MCTICSSYVIDGIYSVILISCFIGSQMFHFTIFLSQTHLSTSEVVKDNVDNERPKDEEHQRFWWNISFPPHLVRSRICILISRDRKEQKNRFIYIPKHQNIFITLSCWSFKLQCLHSDYFSPPPKSSYWLSSALPWAFTTIPEVFSGLKSLFSLLNPKWCHTFLWIMKVRRITFLYG